ncbi:TonB-dependent receptor [Sinimarinibacterium sp. CAU 1509]|uniref:TonB-dependent receptor plug domain-containing protein n=1 Tax=Sinimarinibacterium sp. CAU 1509 TaxID=2562283 RepID=UPI0010ABCBC2|nr:TonB-dependent receptor [Sinimarinibacterium sp. CAU 1509]TJY64971.1 TonB-dependent receptor [Sinimarinibacterium sp. CAU 1509]
MNGKLARGLLPASWMLAALLAGPANAQDDAMAEVVPTYELESAELSDSAVVVTESASDEGEPQGEPSPASEDAAVSTIGVEPLRADGEDSAIAEDRSRLETIEVTGSRIRRTDYETAQPVLLISRQDIERSGMTSIGDLLQNLPQAGAALNTAFNNGGDGAVEIDLRNLGSNRVLVLVNGRRWVGGLSQLRTNSVDLNTIPISIIDSIEVLKDGASAVYGSDAIAGVVNIKTRRDFDGAELRGQAQVYDDGKGLTQSYSYAAGSNNGSTGVFMDLSYVNQSELFAGDRDLSSVPTYGTGISRGSSFTPQGRILFVPNAINGNVIANGQTDPASACYDLSGAVAGGALSDPFGTAGAPDPGVGGIDDPGLSLPFGSPLTICDLARRPGQGTDPSGNYVRFDQNVDAYNYAPINYLLTPSERYSIFGQLTHEFDSGIRFTSEALYNLRKSAQRLAETPVGVGDALPAPFSLAYVDSTNPYNPTNPQSPYYIPGTTAQDIGRGDAGTGLIGLGAVLRRMVELGPRQFEQDVGTYRVGGGFDGQFGLYSSSVDWNLGAAYSESTLATTEAGLINMERLARAVGPLADCAGDDVNSAPPSAAGCVPFDLFGGPGTITPEMLGYVAYTAHDTARQQQRLFYGNASTNLPIVDWLPGALGVATGVELRTESFESTPDATKVAGISSTNASAPTHGSYDAFEAYIELAIPLLANLPLINSFDLSLATRYSDYGDIGSNTSSKVGLEWRMFDNLLLRGTWSEAFRAPSITELYLGAVTSFPEVNDPCASGERDTDPNVSANCDADGAASSQTNAQLPTIYGGNPDLNPETATSITAGLVYSPDFIQDFSVTVDWYQIQLDDFISFIGTDQIFELCYRADPDQRALCDRVQRGPSGEISSIQNSAVNFSALEVAGVDINLDWRIHADWLDQLGSFRVMLDGSYVSEYTTIVPASSGPDVRSGLVGYEFGGQGAIPRFKANAQLIYSNGPWEASWTTRFIYHVYEVCDDGYQDPGAAAGGGNPTPILSLDEYGLCSGPVHPDYGVLNEIKTTFYHDVQLSYDVPNWNTRLVIGVINALDQDPPPVYSSFASSYDPTTYDVPGSRTPYIRFVSNF